MVVMASGDGLVVMAWWRWHGSDDMVVMVSGDGVVVTAWW